MFIELADHLRCPADHAEAYLVLLPELMERRSVRSGHLGCPACGRSFDIVDGVFDVGGKPRALQEVDRALVDGLSADAMLALAGVQGPGGYLVLVGSASRDWRALAELLPGVHLVAANPEPAAADQPGLSVLRGAMLPLKSSSMRGVVLGTGFGNDAFWVGEAVRVTLPGLRIVGAGETPLPETIDLMASAGGVWVGARARSRR